MKERNSKITICTIISKNYLAHARVLTESFLKNNPNGKVYVLLVDTIDKKINPKKEKFTLVEINEIGIKNLEMFCFKYDILEQNTGTKANFLKYLLKKYELKKLAYFDPDIMITNSLENLWDLLDKKSIVLTPHLTNPIIDDKYPSEMDILRSGSYNLGFIALSHNKTSLKFLDWWIPHLMEHGFSDIEKGLFTDQKWIDLVPSIFDDVYIIRHPGYNIAYWNLQQRNVEISNKGTISINNKPMYFFHFSGFAPEKMESISKHQNRFVLRDIESVRPLFELYRDLLVENGYLEIKNWKCKFDYFDNGIKIPKFARKIYAKALNNEENFKNPFLTSKMNSFLNFLNENVDEGKPIITRLWYELYKNRKDLQDTFQDLFGKDRKSFVRWIEQNLKKEYDFDTIFLPSDILSKSDQIIINQSKVDVIIGRKSIEKNTYKSNLNKVAINISGNLKGEFGIAEAGRCYATAIKDVGIPFVLNNIDNPIHRNEDKAFERFEESNSNPINLIIVNPDQLDVFFKEVGPKYLENKYNIGIWFWELTDSPKEWHSYFKYYDEIWAASSFITNSIAKLSPIPVIKITCPIEIDESKFIENRLKFKLKEEDFIFLFIFDFFSVLERKNPFGVIEAFKNAFSEEENVVLIIKSINGSKSPSENKKLQQMCQRKDIILFDEHMNRDEVYSLLASSDCYVSLHRSEGYGLTIAEAMYAKKPVIATSYGGNTDFMNVNNSFPVKYKIEKLDRDHGVYKKGSVWADPDLDHASSLMRYVFENPEDAKKMGINACTNVKNQLNYLKTGNEILERIKNIINVSTEV